MQVRDLIEELKQFPEDWPVAYENRDGAVPIEVSRSEGKIDPLGTKQNSSSKLYARDSQRPFVAIHAWVKN